MQNPWPDDRSNFERNLAVIIGIDDYKGTRISKLSTPVSDATALADLLQGKFGYDNVRRLINADASLAGLKTLFNETLPNELKPTEGDRLIIYFAGHGVPKNSDEGPTGYLVPQDARSGEEKTFLPMKEVWEALEKLGCHHLLIILDCCFAGQFRWASSRKLTVVWDEIHREHYDRFIRYPAWQVITSSAHDQEALDQVKLSQDNRGTEGDTKHSPFALALLEALGDGYTDNEGKNLSADYTKDGVITSQELIVYLEDRLAKLSNSRQVPGLYPLKRGYDKGQFIFVKPGFNPTENLTPAPELNPENNPYRGLNSFEERQANFFFGREKLIDELRDRLVNSPNNFPLIAVLGVSGSGKSSLVKAGLVPKLREQSEKKWYILEPMRPGLLPFTELAKVFLSIINPELLTDLNQVSFLDEKMKAILDSKSGINKDLGNGTSARANNSEQSLEQKNIDIKLAKKWCSATDKAKLLLILDYYEKLKNFFQGSSEKQESEKLSALHQKITEALGKEKIVESVKSHTGTKILLVIDQFEELITLAQSDSKTNQLGSDLELSTGQQFLEFLKVILQECSKNLRVIVTLRSDFEPRFINSPLEDYWNDARFPVRAMNSDELREAIAGPAEKQALNFQPDELVGQLVDEVGQMPGALPLLSFTLSELYIKLYERNKVGDLGRALQGEDYKALGGVAGALTRRATEEYENLLTESGEVYQATMRRLMLRMVSLEGGAIARRRVLDSELVYVDDAENDRVNAIKDRLVAARLLVKGQENGVSYVEPAHDFLVKGWDKLQDWIRGEQENLSLQRRLTPAAVEWKKEHKTNFLWNADPYLDVLRKKVLNSKNNWLNKVEAEFVQRSIRKKRQNGIILWSSVSVAFILIGATAIIALLQKTETQKQSILTLLKSARANLIAGQQLEAMTDALRAEQQSHNLLFGFGREEVSDQVVGMLIWSVNEIQEQNRWLTKERSWPWHFNIFNTELWKGTNNPMFKILEDNKVKLLDASGRLTTTINTRQGLSLISSSVAFSPKRQQLATGNSSSGTIKLWDASGKLIKNIPYQPKGVAIVEFSPDGRWLATSMGPEVTLRDTSGKSISNIDTKQKAVFAIKFSPDSQQLATAGSDGTVQLWSVSELSLITTINTLQLRPNVAFTPNGQRLGTYSMDDNTTKLWNLNGNEIAHCNTDPKSIFKKENMGFGTKGLWLAPNSPRNGGKVNLLDIKCKTIITIDTKQGEFYSFSFSPNGQRLVVINMGSNEQITLWDTPSKKVIATIPIQKTSGGDYSEVAISPDGKRLATFGDGDKGTVQLWDDKGKRLATQKPVQERLYSSVSSLTFSPDGQRLVTFGFNGVWLWDIKGNRIVPSRDDKGKLLTTPKSLQNHVKTVAFSPDGQLLATGESAGTVQLWDIKRNSITKINTQQGGIGGLSFSPDGRWLATSGQLTDKVKLWNIKGELIATVNTHHSSVYHVMFSPDGQSLVTGGVGDVKVWQIGGEKQLLIRGCKKLQDYLHSNPNVSESDKHLCDDVKK